MQPGSIRTFVRRRFSREEAIGLYFTVSLLACMALVLAFALLAHEVSEDTLTAGSFDAVVGQFLYGLRSPRATWFMTAVSFLGDQRFLVVATAAVAGGLLFARHRVSALLFLGSVVGGFGLMSALKLVYARARPSLWPALVRETTYSFPSGHAVMSTVFFGGVAAVVIHLSRRPGVRMLTAALAAAIVTSVAVTRIYLGAHWATDTLAGVMVGLFWVVVYAAGTEFVSRRSVGAVRPRGGAGPSG